MEIDPSVDNQDYKLSLDDEDCKMEDYLRQNPFESYFYYHYLGDYLANILKPIKTLCCNRKPQQATKNFKLPSINQFKEDFYFSRLEHKKWAKIEDAINIEKLVKNIIFIRRIIQKLVDLYYKCPNLSIFDRLPLLATFFSSYAYRYVPPRIIQANPNYVKFLLQQIDDFFKLSSKEFPPTADLTYVKIDEFNPKDYYCAVQWTMEEKNIFFEALARYSIHRIDMIQKHLPRKSKISIINYYNLLKNELNRYKKDKKLSNKLVTIDQMPIAYEMSNSFLEFESIQADKIELSEISKLRFRTEGISNEARIEGETVFDKLIDPKNIDALWALTGSNKESIPTPKFDLISVSFKSEIYLIIREYLTKLIARLLKKKLTSLSADKLYQWVNITKSLAEPTPIEKYLNTLSFKEFHAPDNADDENNSTSNGNDNSNDNDYDNNNNATHNNCVSYTDDATGNNNGLDDNENVEEIDNDINNEFFPPSNNTIREFQKYTNPEGILIQDHLDIYNIGITKEDVFDEVKKMDKNFLRLKDYWINLAKEMKLSNTAINFLRLNADKIAMQNEGHVVKKMSKLQNSNEIEDTRCAGNSDSYSDNDFGSNSDSTLQSNSRSNEKSEDESNEKFSTEGDIDQSESESQNGSEENDSTDSEVYDDNPENFLPFEDSLKNTRSIEQVYLQEEIRESMRKKRKIKTVEDDHIGYDYPFVIDGEDLTVKGNEYYQRLFITEAEQLEDLDQEASVKYERILLGYMTTHPEALETNDEDIAKFIAMLRNNDPDLPLAFKREISQEEKIERWRQNKLQKTDFFEFDDVKAVDFKSYIKSYSKY